MDPQSLNIRKMHREGETFVKQYLMPVVPQSQIRAKCLACQFRKTGAKRGEILANFSQIFVLQVPGKIRENRMGGFRERVKF